MNRRLSTAIVCVIILVAGVSYITSSAQETQQDSTTPAPDDSQFIIEGATIQVPLEVAAAQQGTLAASTMSENFEGTWPSAGWQLIDQASNDGGEYLWGKRNCHPRAGSFGGWFLGGGAQGSALACSANYPNNALSWARYGPFDLSHATSAQLTFYLWGTIETSQDCTKDSLISASSADGGTFTDGQAFCGDFTTGSAGKGYTKYILDLSNRLGQSQVWIGFFFISDDNITNNGITLDDITLDVTEGTASFSCNSVAEIPTTECAALVALYNSTTGLNWTNHAGWLATNTPCNWYGITCNAGHITEVFLYNNQLNGTIPSDLSKLQALQKLNLSFNGLSGNVPPQLGNLSNLLEFTLAFNQLSGTTPSDLSNLSSLKYLDLTSNQLSGTIPPTLGSLNRLSTLLLSKNQLSGSAPSELGNLVNLQYLYLDNNLFDGTLPENLVNLTGLTHFWFQNTSLCEPGDAAFQAWLASIGDLNRTNVPCNNTESSIATAISGGLDYTCALISGAGPKCWGANWGGSLGDGTTIQRLTPVDVVGLSTEVSAIAAGSYHTCALASNGGMKCWGTSNDGALGDGTTTPHLTPIDVVGLSSGVSAAIVGNNHTCALTNSGGVKCWGRNEYGELGDGTTTSRLTPVDVVGLNSGVIAIAAGGAHTCALTNSGRVKCWGENADGELGDGTTIQRLTPVDVVGLSTGVSAIAVGFYHTCALMNSGGVKCWGSNAPLGDGTTTRRLTPVDVVGLNSGVTAITAGTSTNCALTNSGGVKCWGNNGYGDVGDGTTIQRLTPVDVVGLSTGVSAITVGHSHTCALTNSGGVKCWGDNFGGQLGDGTTTQRLAPIDVMGLGGSSPTSTPVSPTATPAPTTTSTPIPSADLGFRPNPNGYNFPNYGGLHYTYSDGDYGKADMELMFGSNAVCSAKIGGVCILKLQAWAWHNWVNSEMNDGHCYGMAVESLRFFKNLDQPSLYQTGATTTFDLTKDNAKRRIAYFFVEQYTEPVRSYLNKNLQNTPTAILDQLRSALQATSDPPILAILTPNRKSGHAITPYKIESHDNGVFWVQVYDNNYPSDANRYVIIDTVANTWSYDLGGSLGTWSGSASTQTLGLVPVSLHSEIIATCPWCGNTSQRAVATNLIQLWSTGNGNLLITDDQGRRIGFSDNQFINEIPNAYSHSVLGGLAVDTEPIYILPLSDEYTILLDGSPLTQAKSIEVTQFGPGYAVSVEDIALNPKTQDQLTIASDGTQITYHVEAAKAITLSLALDVSDSSTQFQLQEVDIGPGQTVRATVDTTQGKLAFSNVQTGDGEYNLKIDRASAAGAQTFIHSTLTILAGDTQYVNYGAWNGIDSIFLEVDHGSDGTIDQMISLGNEVKKIYLPIIGKKR